MILGIAIYALALISKSIDLKKASLTVFLMIALISVPTYVTGNAADGVLGDQRPEVSIEALHAHQSVALLGLIFIEFTGLLSWVALWRHRRTGGFTGWHLGGVLVLALLTMGVMAQAANIGGLINHPEIRGDEQIPAALGLFSDETIKEFVLTDHTNSWVIGETLHFIGLSVLFGIVLLLDLRMLGLMKRIPFSALHKLMPWAVGAFTVNLATGMMFFVAQSDQYIKNDVFYWKLAFVLVAGLNALYLTVLDEPWEVAAGEDAPGREKLMAATAIAVWIGIIYCGQMLPFIGGAF